jgi:outer membrane biosynthesis protein TonB
MAWLSMQFRKNPLQNFFLSIIIAIHLFFLLLLLISPSFAIRKKEHKPLIVKTITPKVPARAAAVEKKSPGPKSSAPAAQKTAPKTPAPAKKETPAPKTTAQKKTPSEKKEPAVAEKKLSKSKQPPPPAKKNPPQQNRAKISDSLLKELEDSIAKIENKKPVSKAISPGKALAPIPLQIDLLSSDHEDASADYSDLLVGYLHQSLSLPDYGEVKIQLSLRQDGSVSKVIVLKTQSEKNKRYLESSLPKLNFPRFEGTYSNKKECTFILTFCNE